MKIGIINCIEVSQFFAQVGFRCPSRRNPSDHFLRCVNSDFDHVNATLRGSLKILKKTVFTLSLSLCVPSSFPLSLTCSFSLFVLSSISLPTYLFSLSSERSLSGELARSLSPSLCSVFLSRERSFSLYFYLYLYHFFSPS